MPYPQNKVFHSSKSFYYRHAIIVGTHNWGYRRYWKEVFTQVGIDYTSFFIDHLDRVDIKKIT